MQPPSPSPVLVVKPSPGKGRSLHSTTSFKPGTLIASLTPAILVPPRSHVLVACNSCLSVSDDPSPKPCGGCRAAAYCSKACQRRHWEAIHKRECKVLRRLPPGSGGLPSLVRALIQALVLLDGADQGGSVGAVAGLRALDGNADKVKADGERWSDVVLQARAAAAYVAGPSAPPRDKDVRWAAEVLCRLMMNMFDRTDEDLETVGIVRGGKVVLRAERPIEPDDEIEISYIDYTYPLEQRQKALSGYYFRCQCARCQGDLTAYDICRSSPLLMELNDKASLTSSTKLKDAPVPSKASRALADEAFETWLAASKQPTSFESLRVQYVNCAALARDGLWALQPLPQLLTDITVFYTRNNNFAYALATACLAATRSTPIMYVPPFHVSRTKGLFALAKLFIADATESPAPAIPAIAAGRQSVRDDIVAVLKETDEISLVQVLLLLVARYGPQGHSDAWKLAHDTKEALDDVGSVPNREREVSLIQAWAKNPDEPKNRAFFEFAVLKPVESLACLGERLLRQEFGM